MVLLEIFNEDHNKIKDANGNYNANYTKFVKSRDNNGCGIVECDLNFRLVKSLKEKLETEGAKVSLSKSTFDEKLSNNY